MTSKTAIEKIFGIVKDRENEIKGLKKNKSLKDPIQIDLVKTQKCMGYEEILEILRDYKDELKSKK